MRGKAPAPLHGYAHLTFNEFTRCDAPFVAICQTGLNYSTSTPALAYTRHFGPEGPNRAYLPSLLSPSAVTRVPFGCRQGLSSHTITDILPQYRHRGHDPCVLLKPAMCAIRHTVAIPYGVPMYVFVSLYAGYTRMPQSKSNKFGHL